MIIRTGLVLAMLFTQWTFPLRKGSPPSGPSCIAPTAYETNQWPIFNGSTTCAGGCTTGNAINTAPDTVGTSSLLGPGGGQSPTYQTSAFGSLSSASYNSIPQQYFELSVNINTPTTFSFWVIFKQTGSAAYGAIYGTSVVGGLEVRINPSGHIEVLEANTVSLFTGTNTYATGTAYAVGGTLNTSTGAWTLYRFNGGASSVDASGTVSMTFVNPLIHYIGITNGSANPFNGLIPDGGFNTGTWNSTALTTIATYVNCEAGI